MPQMQLKLSLSTQWNPGLLSQMLLGSANMELLTHRAWKKYRVSLGITTVCSLETSNV